MHYRLYAMYAHGLDSKSLFEELEEFQLNVVDMIERVVVHGEVDIANLEQISAILYKYGYTEFSLIKI